MGARTDCFREFNVYAPRALAGIDRLASTMADRSFRIDLIRKRRDERLNRFSPWRQTKTLARLRDDLHLAALEHARMIAAWYDRAEELPIPDQVDDRLRDIFEPIFAIAATADAERGITLHVDAMMKAAKALSGIRIEDDTHEAALVAALTSFESICEPNGRGIVISVGGALSLFRQSQGLSWVDSREKARGLLRRFGFRSAIHRRERFWTREQLDPGKETARGYEINLATLRDLLSRYCPNQEPSQPSHPNGQNGFVQVCNGPNGPAR